MHCRVSGAIDKTAASALQNSGGGRRVPVTVGMRRMAVLKRFVKANRSARGQRRC